ncbi:MAG: dicarboxylate/amino acid:cation symporter [Porticoccaceae bacterium]
MAGTSSFYLTPLKYLSGQLDRLIQNRLWIKVLIGLALGIVCGFLLGPELGFLPRQTVTIITAWLALPGQLFLALIQMIVVPLVIASVVRGLASNSDPGALRNIGLAALAFILLTTAIGTTTGIGLGQIIQPGLRIDSAALGETIDIAGTERIAASGFPAAEDVPERVIGLFPKNPMESMVSGEMLQVILFAAILGFALISIPPKQARPLFELLGALQEVSMRVVSWAMHLAPFAVFGLITRLVANLGLEVLAGMFMYMTTATAGLLLLALLYLLIARFLAGIRLRLFSRLKYGNYCCWLSQPAVLRLSCPSP